MKRRMRELEQSLALFSLQKEAGFTILDEGIRSLPFWDNGIRFFNVLGPNKEVVEFGQIL